MQWKDTSSFSQRDIERKPRTFSLVAGGMKLCVTRHIHYEPDAWILQCDPYFREKEIGNGTAEEAQQVALEMVRKKVSETLAILTPNV